MPNGVEAGVHDIRQLEPASRDRLIRLLGLPTCAGNWGVNLDDWRATSARLEELGQAGDHCSDRWSGGRLRPIPRYRPPRALLKAGIFAVAVRRDGCISPSNCGSSVADR
jgi:hypothetical protein